jgi:hypothetical protein
MAHTVKTQRFEVHQQGLHNLGTAVGMAFHDQKQSAMGKENNTKSHYECQVKQGHGQLKPHCHCKVMVT